MPTAQQNEDFQRAVFPMPWSALDDAIKWIKDHLEPDDVFPEDELQSWADENGYTKDTE